jgi:FkbM family methyltransferase
MKQLKKILQLLLIDKKGIGTILFGPAKGLKMYNIALGQIFNRYEPNLLNIINKYVNKDDIVFDVGANRGYITLVLSNAVGNSGMVYSFEPIPSTFNKLSNTISLNLLKNISLNNFALSNKTERVIFNLLPENDSTASMVWHTNNPIATKIEVGCVELDFDDNLKNLKPNFIKIDVEGSENKVIEGMLGLINNCKPIIYTEVSELGREFVWNNLQKIGYSCFSSENETKIENFNKYFHGDFLWIYNKS